MSALAAVGVTGAVGLGVAVATTETDTVVVPSIEVRTASASCPGDSHLLPAGFKGDLQGFDKGDADILTTALRRTSGETLKATGLNDGSGDGGLTAIAYCGHRPGGVAVSESKTVQGLDRKSATAQCPGDKKVLFGGFKTEIDPDDFSPGIIIAALERTSAGSWRATGVNIREDPGKVTAIAYCGNGPALDVKTKTVVVDYHKAKSVTANCPQGEVVAFGGYKGEIGNVGVAAEQDPIVMVSALRKASASAWKASARNISNATPTGSAGTLESIAYCR